MNRTKFLLIICEGTTDKVTLYLPTKNFVDQNKLTIKTEITHGDVALKDNATVESCQKEIKKIIDYYKRAYSLMADDFFGVYHIIDTDGAFIEKDIYKEADRYFIDEATEIIFTNDIEKSKKLHSQKKKIYACLSSLGEIANVNYKVLFFSRNLEHTLYDKPNCTNCEKINLSKEFESLYENDANEFYKLIDNCAFSVPKNYNDSWKYIMSDTNSIHRGENYIIMLNDLKNNG